MLESVHREYWIRSKNYLAIKLKDKVELVNIQDTYYGKFQWI